MYRLNEIFFVTSLLCVSNTWTKEMTEIERLAATPTQCTYEKAFEMYGAYCAGLRLWKIPKLKGGIEILDFSDNKLTELNADMLYSYSGIKFLYLAENHIYEIDDNAFSAFTNLQTLDLSNNVLLSLPNSIVQLPSLRKLYLKGNPFMHTSKEFEISRPIKAPLEHLDISDCKLVKLPNWGSLPQLVYYNISHNPLTVLNTDHFAPMCSLKKVDLTESTNNLQLCSMRSPIMWFHIKGIDFVLEKYDKLNTREFSNCPMAEGEHELHNVTYHRCKADYLQVQSIRTSRRTWLTIGGGLTGFLVGFILLLYVMHRHNVAQTKSKAEKLKQATPTNDPDKTATANLLRNLS